MLDINLFREDKGHNPEIIRESQRRRFADVGLVDQVIQLDKEWRQRQFELDNLRKDFNKINKEVARLKISGEDASHKIKDTEENKQLTAKKEAEVQEARAALYSKLEIIGNLVHDSVPVSNDEANNAIVRSWGEKRTENGLKNHVDLVELLGIADIKKGANVAGGRGYYLKGDGVLLNQALINFALNFLRKRGYNPLQTPFFMRKEIMAKCAQLAQFDEELYKVTHTLPLRGLKMSSSLHSPLYSSLSSSSALQEKKLRNAVNLSKSTLTFKPRRYFPLIRASTGFSSSLDTGLSTELDAVTSHSEIVPDTVIFDDFEKFPPTAATVSSSLLLGICGLPDTKFKSAVDRALADSECYGLENSDLQMSCFFNKALAHVGGDLAKLVPGRVSTEVDARLAYDTHGIVRKVHDLLKAYNEIEVPPERLLFKIPATWQGIEASRVLEAEGIQTHLTFVYSFCQAAAAAQAGASVIQIFVGRLRDWSRNHTGDSEIESALKRGEDPGLALVTKAYNYIHKYGHKSKLMAAAVRNKQDVFNLLGVDYIITPLKVLQSLKESVTPPDEKYSFIRRLSPQSAAAFNFTQDELQKWDQYSFSSAMGPAAVELLTIGMDGYTNQAKRVEEFFGKIWPPPNV